MRPVTVLLLVAVYETTRALLKRGALSHFSAGTGGQPEGETHD
jgi:hypothetical protein